MNTGITASPLLQEAINVSQQEQKPITQSASTINASIPGSGGVENTPKISGHKQDLQNLLSSLESKGTEAILNQDNSALYSLLNENKVLSILESAILEKFGDALSNDMFEQIAGQLYSELEQIEEYVVAGLKLAGNEVSPDRHHWSRNKLRSQWAERIASSWKRGDQEGVDALKNRIPAIIAISIRQTGKLNELSSEPFGMNDQTQIRMAFDKVASKSLELALQSGISASEAVRTITQDITELAVQYQQKVFAEALPDGNSPAFVLSVCLDRVGNQYKQVFLEARSSRSDQPYVELLSNVRNQVEEKMRLINSVSEDVVKNNAYEPPKFKL
ncbi:MAG: hypothetical protein U9N57_14215 [Pseudomonadota bacterium]|nr:hypothetical protein [Pseudomonadota bacterium]